MVVVATLLLLLLILFLLLGLLGFLATSPVISVALFLSVSFWMISREVIQEARRREEVRVIQEMRKNTVGHKSVLTMDNDLVKLTRTRSMLELNVPLLNLYYKKEPS